MLFRRISKKSDSPKDAIAKSQKLIIITGCAGSGKTTIGKALAKRLHYVYIDKDTVTREFTDYILESQGASKYSRESELYRKKVMHLEYNTTFKLCRELLETGSDVIVTIPFQYYITDYHKWLDFREKSNIPSTVDVKFVWIEHRESVEKVNLTRRNADRDQYKLKNWDEYAHSIDGIKPCSDYNAYKYVNDCNVQLDVALNDLAEWIIK